VRAETAGIIAGQTPSHNLRVSVTTLGYRQLWQDRHQPSRANLSRGELTEMRRCKPRRGPLLVRPLPTSRARGRPKADQDTRSWFGVNSSQLAGQRYENRTSFSRRDSYL